MFVIFIMVVVSQLYHILKLIKMYILNMYSLSYASDTVRKLLTEKVVKKIFFV